MSCSEFLVGEDGNNSNENLFSESFASGFDGQSSAVIDSSANGQCQQAPEVNNLQEASQPGMSQHETGHTFQSLAVNGSVPWETPGISWMRGPDQSSGVCLGKGHSHPLQMPYAGNEGPVPYGIGHNEVPASWTGPAVPAAPHYFSGQWSPEFPPLEHTFVRNGRGRPSLASQRLNSPQNLWISSRGRSRLLRPAVPLRGSHFPQQRFGPVASASNNFGAMQDPRSEGDMGPPLPPVPRPYIPTPAPFAPPPDSFPVPDTNEAVSPPRNVEATTAKTQRRKILKYRDIAPIELRRVMLSLKSGLLAETTWALDVLNILCHDDHSFPYMTFRELPELLDTLLEHLQRSLILVFGESFDSNEDLRSDKEKEEVDIGSPYDKVLAYGYHTPVLEESPNYTMTCKFTGKEVLIVDKDEEPFVLDGPRDWHVDEKLRQGLTPNRRSDGHPNHCGGESSSKRKLDAVDAECVASETSSLGKITEKQDGFVRKCLTILNILRNLTFLPENEAAFGKNATFLKVLGKLLLLQHSHAEKRDKSSFNKVEQDGNEKLGTTSTTIDASFCVSLHPEKEWWTPFVPQFREYVLVMLANISGALDLSPFPEPICRPIFTGLLHWATCRSAVARDSFPDSDTCPHRLAVEALCKMSVREGNADLLLATPPFSEIERLCQLLCASLGNREDKVMKEFGVSLLSDLSSADSGLARAIALQKPGISQLISFIEQAKVNATYFMMTHGILALQQNPVEAIGTTLHMLVRAATTLLNLARHPDNRGLFREHETRILQLSMNRIPEPRVATILTEVLFHLSAGK